jgi:hypothetical protein
MLRAHTPESTSREEDSQASLWTSKPFSSSAKAGTILLSGPLLGHAFFSALRTA